MFIAITRRSISVETAKRLLDAGEATAQAHGKPMILAVVDELGVFKAFRRMDGAPLLSVELAIDKAFTAVSFGMISHAWFDFIKDDEPLRLGIVKTDRLVVFGGSYPVTHEGEVIGVSGGHYSEDMNRQSRSRGASDGRGGMREDTLSGAAALKAALVTGIPMGRLPAYHAPHIPRPGHHARLRNPEPAGSGRPLQSPGASAGG